MARSSLYFVALTPEASFTRFIRKLQQEMCDQFGVCHALRTPPHITLVPPFRALADQEVDLNKALLSISFDSFQLPILGMGRFGKRVIFVKPEVNPELKLLHTSAQKAFELWSKPEQRPFHPHFTIGYRDLEPVFLKAWKHFEAHDIPSEMCIENIVLFKYQEKRWEILTKKF